MKLWITEIGEPLPLEEGVRLLNHGEFARYMAEQGHEVVWWSSSFSHVPKKHYASGDIELSHGKAMLKILHGPGYKKNVSLQRIRHQRHFAKRFLELAFREKKPDIILAPIPTIEVAHAVNTYCQQTSVPYYVNIRDVWPDELKYLAPKPLQALARILLQPLYAKMEKICSQAHGIMGVSRSYMEYGLKFAGRAASQKDCVFPLGYKTQSINDDDRQNALRFWKKSGITPDAFIISFVGTIGHSSNLETVMKVANKLQTYPDIQFVFAGDGSHLQRYKNRATKFPNVFFPGWIGISQIKTLLEELSNIGLAPYRTGSFMSLPNKPFEYMASGLPVISSIQGELKSYLEEHEAGFTYDADDPQALEHHILSLYRDREASAQKGANAKRLFLEHFDIDVIFKNIHSRLIEFDKNSLQ